MAVSILPASVSAALKPIFFWRLFMTVSQKQTVEIVKVLYRGADILILDEPTAVLTPQETERLFAVLRNMRDAGKAVVIITHKLHEVADVSDRVAILRRGAFVGDMPTKDTNIQEMTNMMVGRPVTLNIERPEVRDSRDRIEVKNLTVTDQDGVKKLDGVSFTARTGEILGIAGISGCGQKELLEAIAGLQPVESGSIEYVGDDGTREELIGKNPLDIAHLGVSLSFVPEDRLGMDFQPYGYRNHLYFKLSGYSGPTNLYSFDLATDTLTKLSDANINASFFAGQVMYYLAYNPDGSCDTNLYALSLALPGSVDTLGAFPASSALEGRSLYGRGGYVYCLTGNVGRLYRMD